MIKFIKSLGSVILLFIVLAFTYMQKEDTEFYYVYSDHWDHGIPSGFMGERDGKSITLNDVCKDNPYKGSTCIKLSTNGSESWCGLNVHYSGSWNIALSETVVLPDLSAYDRLEYYARSESEDVYIIPEIGVGGGGLFEGAKYNDVFVELGKEWKRYTINLKKADLKKINTLLYFTFPQGVGTLYLDEIKFIKKKTN